MDARVKPAHDELRKLIAMPRHYRDHAPAGPSQRQLRVGVIRPALAAAVLLLGTAAATAEICDKAVGDAWLPGHGPVWLLNPVGFPLGLTMLVVGLVLAARLWWIGFLGSAVLALVAAAPVFADVIPQHEIYRAQLREGCRSLRTDMMQLGLIVTMAVAYAWLGYQARRRAMNVAGTPSI